MTDGGTTFISTYFWLGADGEISEVTEEEFIEKQEVLRASEQRWHNVDVSELDEVSDDEGK